MADKSSTLPVSDAARNAKAVSASKILSLLMCIVGINVSFIFWGIYQEKVTSIVYESSNPDLKPEKFEYIKLLNLFMSLAAALAAIPLCMIQNQPLTIQPFTGFLKISFTNTVGSPFSYIALHYINYPMVTLLKSCKLIPVMIMGSVIGGKKYSVAEYLCVVTLSVGVVLFFRKPNADIGGSDLHSILLGTSLVIVNLAFDGCTNAMQDQIYEEHRISSGSMMLGMNLVSAAMLLFVLFMPIDFDVISSVVMGEIPWESAVLWKEVEFFSAFQFLMDYPESLKDVLIFSFCGAMGQVFIFVCIREFGSLVNTMITIGRKFCSIFFSIVWFNHPISNLQGFGVLLVFASLGYDVYLHSKKPSKKSVDGPKDDANAKKAQ